jgi:prevent-host-death family protein
MQVSVQSARRNLSKLIDAALAGEEVVIARGETPVVKLVPIPRSRFSIGILKGQLRGPVPDFLQLMSEDEVASWEAGGKAV